MSFVSMMDDRAKEVAVKLADMSVVQRSELYTRWVNFFGYEDILSNAPGDVPLFDENWSATVMANRLLMCDPFTLMFEFLLKEGLIIDRSE